jgi:hypothetical protein
MASLNQRRRAGSVVLATLAALAGACAPGLRSDSAGRGPEPAADAGFCARAQWLVNAAPETPANTVLQDFPAFLKSKPSLPPFITTEYWTWADADRTDPRMVSCKLIAADRLRATFGAFAAPAERPCRDVNADTLERVQRRLAEGGRSLQYPASRVILEPDIPNDLGPAWLKTPQRVWADDAGLHIAASAVLAALDDPRLAPAPASVRGTRNCHVIAPDYLSRLLLGDVAAEQAGPPRAAVAIPTR